MPKKALYRQRAHSNPLIDAHFDIPLSPDHYNWCVRYLQFQIEVCGRENADAPSFTFFFQINIMKT